MPSKYLRKETFSKPNRCDKWLVLKRETKPFCCLVLFAVC